MVGDIRHPRGWSRIFVVALVAMSVAGSGLVGARAQEADAGTLLGKAVVRMSEVESFHFDLTTEKGESVILEGLELKSAEGDVQRPDRFRATVTASIAIVTLDVEVVGIGTQLWVSDPTSRDERYFEIDTETGLEEMLNPDRLLLVAVELVQEPTIAGEEEIDGVETTQIDGTVDFGQLVDGVPADLLLAQQMPVRVWIDDEGHVLRLELDGPLMRSDSRDIVRRLSLSKFDEDFDIQPPDALSLR